MANEPPHKRYISILSNRADPDEMLPYAAINLDLHCLPK